MGKYTYLYWGRRTKDCFSSDKKTETCSQFYRSIMSWTPGTFAILIFFILLFLNAKRLGRRERESGKKVRILCSIFLGGQSPRDQDANSSKSSVVSQLVISMFSCNTRHEYRAD